MRGRAMECCQFARSGGRSPPYEDGSELLDAKVAELDLCAVAEEAEVPFFVLEAGVLLEDGGVGDGGEVGLGDDRTVERDGDPGAVGADLFLVPLTGGPEEPGLGGEDVVDRAVVLRGADLRLAVGVLVGL